MTEKKCPVCGGKEFMPYLFADGLHGEYTNYVDSFVCLNCGRVELYAKKDVLDKRIKQDAERKQAAAKDKEIDEEISAKKKELAELKVIVNDENQTVKAVKDAESKIRVLEEELELLENTRRNKNKWRSPIKI